MAETPARRPDDLEALARSRFPDLSEAELRLLHAAPKGEIAYCGPSANDDDPANDPAKADRWGRDRELRAKLIRWLCVDHEASQRIDARGLQVYAGKITGKLDLSYVTVAFPLLFWRCRLTDDANLRDVTIPALNLAGSWTRSLNADGANVTGSVFLRKGFSAEGEVRLLRAQIGGSLECDGSMFRNPGGDALSADGIKVDGGVFLRKGFSAKGEVRLLGAQVGGNLECGGGTFTNPGGVALNADRVKVEDSVFLRKGFSAKSEVRLLGAQVGGNLECGGGTFKNPGGKALGAENANVEGNVFLRDRFSAEGEVLLFGAQIEGGLDCRRGTFGTLDLNTATVKGIFRWSDVQNADTTQLDLRNASVGTVVDKEAS